METKGKAALEKAAKRRGYTQEDLAGLIGVSQGTISRWLAGDDRPTDKHRRVIKARLRIPTDSWLTAEEREEVRKLTSPEYALAHGARNGHAGSGKRSNSTPAVQRRAGGRAGATSAAD